MKKNFKVFNEKVPRLSFFYIYFLYLCPHYAKDGYTIATLS